MKKRVSRLLNVLVIIAVLFGTISWASFPVKAAGGSASATFEDCVVNGKVGDRISEIVVKINLENAKTAGSGVFGKVVNTPKGVQVYLMSNGMGDTYLELKISGVPAEAKEEPIQLTIPGGYLRDLSGVAIMTELVVTTNPKTAWNIKEYTKVSNITVESSADTVGEGKSLQMTAAIQPEDAGNKDVTWSVENQTGAATITSAGLLSGVKAGTVTVNATAKDGSNVVGNKVITILHTHTPSTAWSKDTTNHWHNCTANDGEKLDASAHVASGWIVGKAATETEKGSRYKECTVCGFVMEKEEISSTETPSYIFTQGANSRWTANSKTGITFTVNSDFSKFKGVKINGELINASNYTAQSGSTIVTLKPEYLKTLKAGTYDFTIVLSDNEVSTTFTVSDSVSPSTGSGENLAFCLVLFALSGCAAAFGFKRKRYLNK